MKKLPIKSLAQFRSVSKAWKSLIDSVKFIADHYYYNVCQPPHLFIIGSSHGLFCFYNAGISKAFIWNPSIRKSIAIVDLLFPVVKKLEKYISQESIKSRILSISKLRETLVVLEYNKVALCARQLCAVWMMDNDSFTQIYTINAPATSLDTILGFRNNGAMIIERQNDKKGNAYQR
ncbi:putative F-box protein, partial [Tanacetum coccineum]